MIYKHETHTHIYFNLTNDDNKQKLKTKQKKIKSMKNLLNLHKKLIIFLSFSTKKKTIPTICIKISLKKKFPQKKTNQS
jgi:hypothetical protein